jgi:hypothetical protein
MDGDAGIVEGKAAGVLTNITKGLERTFVFDACWRQPYPFP